MLTNLFLVIVRFVISNLINLPSRCRCVFSREVFGRSLRMKNALAKCFYGAFLSFAFHAIPVLATSTISYRFGC